MKRFKRPTLQDLAYDLPKELIAQNPLRRRDDSRLMTVDPYTADLFHGMFYDIVDYFHNGDVLVFNDSKVIPARIQGYKDPTLAIVELLLLEIPVDNVATALVRNARVLDVGVKVVLDKTLEAVVEELLGEGVIRFRFHCQGDCWEIIQKIGELPLPPYINEFTGDRERYQTIYAEHPGSVAAPTAGLHFTPMIMDKIANRRLRTVFITLHVGMGTFKPIKSESIEEHKMHEEVYTITPEGAMILNAAYMNSDRIIAIGTTTLRALEANFRPRGFFAATTEKTDIFIYPPQSVKSVNVLITNFHQPNSTLLLLVMAIAGVAFTREMYREAIRERYRFLSFGDASIIDNDLYNGRFCVEDNFVLTYHIQRNKMRERNKKPRLLLHACCGPCLMYAIDFLRKYYEVVVYFDNSNIFPMEEYRRRLFTLTNFLELYEAKFRCRIKLIVAEYDPSLIEYCHSYIDYPEHTFRCFGCYQRRLQATYRVMKRERCQFFATTMTASPYKNIKMINAIGLKIGEVKGKGILDNHYLPTNFRAEQGLITCHWAFQSIPMYRQRYCGCNPNDPKSVMDLGLTFQEYAWQHGLEYRTSSEVLDQQWGHLRRGRHRMELNPLPPRQKIPLQAKKTKV